MILWVVLFGLVLGISFILAAQSMRDFSEIPSDEKEYSLFLIRHTQGLTPTLLDSIRNELLESKAIISFERLFKGSKSAMVVFGPRSLLLNHVSSLDLLELENYTNVSPEFISAWEVVVKKDAVLQNKVFANLAHFPENEQFWWQVILSHSFKPQITAIVVTADSTNRHNLSHNLQNLEGMQKLPKAFSNAQLLEFYQNRSVRKDNKNQAMHSEKILQLILI